MTDLKGGGGYSYGPPPLFFYITLKSQNERCIDFDLARPSTKWGLKFFFFTLKTLAASPFTTLQLVSEKRRYIFKHCLHFYPQLLGQMKLHCPGKTHVEGVVLDSIQWTVFVDCIDLQYFLQTHY